MPKRKRSDEEDQTEVPADIPKVLSPLEALPTELLQRVVLSLPAEELRTIQFVSKRLKSISKKPDGTNLIPEAPWKMGPRVYRPYTFPRPRDLHPYIVERVAKRGQYGAFMARIEASMQDNPGTSQLTCSKCGKLAGNWLNLAGFCDQQFNRRLASRSCLSCMYTHGTLDGALFTIKGNRFFRCLRCHKTKPDDDRMVDETIRSASTRKRGTRLWKDLGGNLGSRRTYAGSAALKLSVLW